MIKKGSWVKYGTDYPVHMEAVGVVTGVFDGRDRTPVSIEVRIFYQTTQEAWSLPEDIICKLASLTELSEAEAVLLILKNEGGKNG